MSEKKKGFLERWSYDPVAQRDPAAPFVLAVLGLGFAAGVVYVIAHFIIKYW